MSVRPGKRTSDEEDKNHIDYKFDVYVVHPLLDTTMFIPKVNNKAFVWGRHNDTESDIKTLVDMIFFIVSNELKDFDNDAKDIVDVVIELAIKNEEVKHQLQKCINYSKVLEALMLDYLPDIEDIYFIVSTRIVDLLSNLDLLIK